MKNNNTNQTHAMPGTDPDNNAPKLRNFLGGLAKSAQTSLKQLVVPKYSLPDKTVASQVLMYRQLLHTSCRPGLKLSRPYQGTAAQLSVVEMPWWTVTIDPTNTQQKITMRDTGKMVIEYDNLLTRLWNTTTNTNNEQAPVPHDDWIHVVGFQQNDPVTDFRSGGILSLAVMVWIVESCQNTYNRFVGDGDASVLPFGITSINVTDMLAKFLMLSKGTDRMEALLSQKPFWNMFSDPYSILCLQELSLELLADVVVELSRTRTVSVFDFAEILKTTEYRVEHDLLGAGPQSLRELRSIYARLKLRYQQTAAEIDTTHTLVNELQKTSLGVADLVTTEVKNTVDTAMSFAVPKKQPAVDTEEIDFTSPPETAPDLLDANNNAGAENEDNFQIIDEDDEDFLL